MSTMAGVAAALLTSVGLAGWWYFRREEEVRGRAVAALLRGTALFLALSSPWLPPLRGDAGARPLTALLVDRSISMRLPASRADGTPRWDVAMDSIRSLAASRTSVAGWTFAASASPFDPTRSGSTEGSPDTPGERDTASLVIPAIEAARAAGADTLIVVTDGELGDREAGRRLAERYGLAVREVPVGEQVTRAAIRSVDVPEEASGGDSVEVGVELVSQGPGPSRIAVTLSGTAFDSARSGAAAPAPGRTSTVQFRVRVRPVRDTVEWRFVDFRIEGSEPEWPAIRRRTWIRVTPQPTGAVMVSVDPDWESRFLLPLLLRAAPGGARTFLRVGDETFLSGGPSPRPGIGRATVLDAVNRARLLVVQGDPAELPGWLGQAMESRPSVLFLARGSGRVPGTMIEISEPLPGEWYAARPPPAGPVSALIAGVRSDDLPPLFRLYGSTGRPEWVALEARRDRRGAPRPVVTLGETEGRRWAVVHSEGTWRWAARGGAGLALYRGLYAGLTNWLVETATSSPIDLDGSELVQGRPIRWRVSPDVAELALAVTGPEGTVVWRDSLASPAGLVPGPALGAGDASFRATGRRGDRSFAYARPFHVAPAAELVPGPFGPALDVDAPSEPAPTGAGGRGGPPVWPFGAAILLLCAEWLWRRRIGLR